MNVRGDRSQPGSLSAVGWDDEGVKPESFDIVQKGIFVDYHTTREQAPVLADYYKRSGRPVRSHGCSYAQTWADVQFQRMPNVSLLPGEKEQSWDDLIAATDRGIAINAIAPGGTATDMAAEHTASYTPVALRDVPAEAVMKSMNALGRLAEPDEIAAVATFLLSPDASYITGATIDAAGGWI